MLKLSRDETSADVLWIKSTEKNKIINKINEIHIETVVQECKKCIYLLFCLLCSSEKALTHW